MVRNLSDKLHLTQGHAPKDKRRGWKALETYKIGFGNERYVRVISLSPKWSTTHVSASSSSRNIREKPFFSHVLVSVGSGGFLSVWKTRFGMAEVSFDPAPLKFAAAGRCNAAVICG